MLGEKTTVIPGLDSKERLLRFLAAKKHLNLVLRIVDLLELRHTSLDFLLEQVSRVSGPLPAERQGGWRKQWLLRQFPSGWVVVPIAATLESLDLGQVEKLQQVLYEYRSIRLEKGEPHTIRPCEKCGGKGCQWCGGEGHTITFEEMSEWETMQATTPLAPA
jgi:hypothetical protein